MKHPLPPPSVEPGSIDHPSAELARFTEQAIVAVWNMTYEIFLRYKCVKLCLLMQHIRSWSIILCVETSSVFILGLYYSSWHSIFRFKNVAKYNLRIFSQISNHQMSDRRLPSVIIIFLHRRRNTLNSFTNKYNQVRVCSSTMMTSDTVLKDLISSTWRHTNSLLQSDKNCFVKRT